jgi:hypothetical protein
LPRAVKVVVGSTSATAFLERRGLPAADVQVFWSSFTEREQANFARLRAFASVDNPGGMLVEVLCPPSGCFLAEIAALRNGKG